MGSCSFQLARSRISEAYLGDWPVCAVAIEGIAASWMAARVTRANVVKMNLSRRDLTNDNDKSGKPPASSAMRWEGNGRRLEIECSTVDTMNSSYLPQAGSVCDLRHTPGNREQGEGRRG